MVRILTDRDIQILLELAPEFSGENCSGSGTAYKSILPPVANHYSKSSDDFKARLERLSTEDLQYLVDMIMKGEEGLHCIPPDYFMKFIEVIRQKFGEDTERQVINAYVLTCE